MAIKPTKSISNGSDAKGQYLKDVATGRIVRLANNSNAERQRALAELEALPPNAADVIYGPKPTPNYHVDEVGPMDLRQHGGVNSPTRQRLIDAAAAARQARLDRESVAALAANEAQRRSDQEAEILRLSTINRLAAEARQNQLDSFTPLVTEPVTQEQVTGGSEENQQK